MYKQILELPSFTGPVPEKHPALPLLMYKYFSHPSPLLFNQFSNVFYFLYYTVESIIIEKGEFSWDSHSGPSVLRNINIKVNSSDLVAVVGHVGSGKSSLLSAILGGNYKKSGSVNTRVGVKPSHFL